ncbi:HU family DNA-binding protein [Treponema pedis]|nr:HU family DNA-binding protein [Treponema pedis]
MEIAVFFLCELTMKQKQSKSNIIDSIYRNNEEYKLKQVKGIVDLFVESISDLLKSGSGVEIRGLGTFEVVPVKARANARNPKTGEKMKVKAHCKVRFKPAKDLKDSLKELSPKKLS